MEDEAASIDAVDAILKHIYGAPINEVLGYMKSSFEHLKEVLRNDPTVFEQLVAIERDFENYDSGKGVWGNTICPSDRDPMPWQSRAAVRTILPIITLYKMADRYEVAEIKPTLLARFRSLLATSWNHSDVLLVIHAIIDTVHEHEVMNQHLFQEIKIRLCILLVEPRFIQFLERVPDFKTRVFEMTISMVVDGCASSYNSYYCPRSDDGAGIHCRQQTVHSRHDVREPRKCDRCGKEKVETTYSRRRLWESEDLSPTQKRDKAQFEVDKESGD